MNARTGIAAVCFVLLLGLVGCSTRTAKQFNEQGIPLDRYLVGGGFEITYIAPVNGIVYYVEESSCRIVETKPLKAGEEAEFEGWDVNEYLGIPLKEAKLALYFIPIK